MKRKNIVSVFAFIYLFFLSYIVASYLSPAIQLHTINISFNIFLLSLKTNVPIKLLAGLMFGIVGACIPQIIWKKK